MDIYEFVKNIGNGMYGQVYLANHKLEQKLYAIKRINFKAQNIKESKKVINKYKLFCVKIKVSFNSFLKNKIFIES